LRPTKSASISRPELITGINPGTITVLGKNLAVTLFGSLVGQVTASWIAPPLFPGTTYSIASTGSTAIGPIAASVDYQGPIDLTAGTGLPTVLPASGTSAKPRTNDPTTGTITESQGQLITWTGGVPDSWVIVSGSSTSSAVPWTVNFYCTALASAQQLMLPPYVLDSLPAGAGTLTVENESQLQTFTATGLDYGYISTGLIATENVTYQLDASAAPPPPPPAESPYNGTYTFTFSGAEKTGKAISGAVTAVIDNGVLTVTNPGNGMGTVSSTGAITFGVDVTEGVSCNFSGQDVVTGGVATATGTFTCANNVASGNWTVTTGG
jgi:hypothetical protein